LNEEAKAQHRGVHKALIKEDQVDQCGEATVSADTLLLFLDALKSVCLDLSARFLQKMTSAQGWRPHSIRWNITCSSSVMVEKLSQHACDSNQGE